jgi:hypothetical protein
MEVHHHPDLHHKRKNFKEYFLEFLMIFLAVTMGFIAENLREQMVENKQGKEYIKSLVEDLRKDTSQYTKLINELTYIGSATDNIFNCYDSITHNVKSTACLNDIVKELLGFTDFVYTDRTMQQLKNAGGLSLIKDKSAADSIITYDAMVHSELIHQEALEIYQQKTIDAGKAIIDFPSFSSIYSIKAGLNYNIQLLQNNKQAIDNYFNDLWVFKKNLSTQKSVLQALKIKAAQLVSFLNNK